MIDISPSWVLNLVPNLSDISSKQSSRLHLLIYLVSMFLGLSEFIASYNVILSKATPLASGVNPCKFTVS